MMCLLGSMALSGAMGQDGNWDLQNYHLYDPFALVNGRLGVDLTPAGIQSFFNPLIDVPYYLLAHDLLPGWPRLVAAISGMPYGVLVFLTWRISNRTLATQAAAVAATVIGATGTITVAEIGTTFGDIPTADLVLAGLLCVIAGHQRPGLLLRAALGAGALAGAACGLKLTNLVFAPALFLGLTVPLLRRPAQALWAAILFGSAGILAVCVVYGWWGVILYRAVGNPVAPLLNGLFRSEWFPLVSFNDTNYLPRTIWQAIFYPFFWLGGRQSVVAEISVRDARFAAAYLAVAGLVLTAILGLRRIRVRLALVPAVAPGGLGLLVFFVTGFVLWEAASSIIRYAVALEALTGTIVMLGLAVLGRFRLMPRRRFAWVTGALVVLILASGKYSDWGRIRKLGPTVFNTPLHSLPPDSLVVLTGAPRGFMALFLQGPRVAFIGVAGMAPGTRPWTEAQSRIASHAGPVFLVNSTAGPNADLSGWGLRQDRSPCQPLPNPYQTGLELCTAEHAGPA